MEIRAQRIDYGNVIGFAIIDHNKELRQVYACGSLTMHEIDDSMPVPTAFELRPEQAIQLMDDLWRAGIRPTENSDTTPAVQRHLNDMRKLVESAYEVKLDGR